jgi:hypothetical protein
MSAVITEDEKNRIRHHTGYLITEPAAAIQLGYPRASQTQFLLEHAMNHVPEAGVGQIRNYIAILDNLENLLVEATTRFAAKRLGEIELRDNETDMIEGEYARWAKRLADDLGIPLNIYSERFRAGSGLSMNMQVIQ